MSIVDLRLLADKPIVFYAAFAHIAGGAANGLFLVQALYWSATSEGGWFRKTHEACTEETTLTRREQEKAREKLLTLGLLEAAWLGIPADLYYRVDSDRLIELLKDAGYQVVDEISDEDIPL